MILQSLIQLAENEGLVDDPDFEYRRVAWVVCLAEDGRLLGIVGTHQDVPGRGKGPVRRVVAQLAVPRFPTGRSGTKAPPAFLVGNAKYVFGRPTPDKDFSAAEGEEKAGWFRALVDQCAAATTDPGIGAVARFLEGVATRRAPVTLPAEAKSNDLFAFALNTPSDLVHERRAVRDYWKARRMAPEPCGVGHVCLVTGEPIGGPGLFPLVRGVPGGSTSGVSFVGFNREAFESHGWHGNANAPISRLAAEAASTALSRLLNPAPPDPRHAGDKLPRRLVKLNADTVVVFWSPSPAAAGFLDSLEGLLAGGADSAGPVRDLYKAVWMGRAPDLSDAGPFYALTITGVQGRAVLRDWMESSVAEVAGHLARYFQHIRVVQQAQRKGSMEPAAVGLRDLMAALEAPGSRDRKQCASALAADFVDAALRGMPLPVSILQRALLRARAEAGRAEWADVARCDARAALIKAVLIRTFHQEVSVSMDPTNSNPGYLLGRLMAVVERMQQAALGEGVNATVVDRYFSGASATPGVVFPRLLKNMRNHARKAKDDDKSAATASWLEAEADKVLRGLRGFPSYLDLEQQGLFVLGYHHERQWLWLPKDQRVALSE